MQLDLEEMSKH
jgi:hypothetical protein